MTEFTMNKEQREQFEKLMFKRKMGGLAPHEEMMFQSAIAMRTAFDCGRLFARGKLTQDEVVEVQKNAVNFILLQGRAFSLDMNTKFVDDFGIQPDRDLLLLWTLELAKLEQEVKSTGDVLQKYIVKIAELLPEPKGEPTSK